MQMQLQVVTGFTQPLRDPLHRRIAEIIHIERLDEKRRGKTVARQYIEHEAQTMRILSHITQHARLRHRAKTGRIGERPTDTELDVYRETDLGLHVALAVSARSARKGRRKKASNISRDHRAAL